MDDKGSIRVIWLKLLIFYLFSLIYSTVNMVALNSEHQKWETILQYWRERKNNLKKLDSDNNKKYSRC